MRYRTRQRFEQAEKGVVQNILRVLWNDPMPLKILKKLGSIALIETVDCCSPCVRNTLLNGRKALMIVHRDWLYFIILLLIASIDTSKCIFKDHILPIFP